MDYGLRKIVLTGGPCAGKTTALSWAVSTFEKMDWKVFVVNEAATELIMAGLKPGDFADPMDFQEALLRTQIFKEDNMEQFIKRTFRGGTLYKTLMICDRGVADNQAYLTKQLYPKLLRRVGLTPQRAFERYDAVFHLVTAAEGAEEAYTLANNEARSETATEARNLDRKTRNAWIGHPHLKVISNENCTFEGKLQKLMAEMAAVLGEPEPFEATRKFLIEYPNRDWFEGTSTCQRVEVMLTYLLSNSNEEAWVRQRGIHGDYTFTKNVRRNIGDPVRCVETESRLTKEEYVKLLMNADSALHPIRKTRYCFFECHFGQYFEIDFYPGSRKYALLEVDVRDKEQEIELPWFVKVIREVTDDPRYRNRAIAENGGKLPKEV